MNQKPPAAEIREILDEYEAGVVQNALDGLEPALIEFLRHKYVTRADERQRGLGLAYLEAEVHDLAREVASFVNERAAVLAAHVQ